MKAGRAFAAGVAGGLVMTGGFGAAVRALGLPLNLELVLGTLFLPRGLTAWLVGLAMHLVISGAIALVYAWGFERVTHRADAGVGAIFSMVHIVIAGLALLAIPAIHPLIPEQMRAPGAFMSGLGVLGVVLFVIEHVIYGALVGAMYGEVREPTRGPSSRLTAAPRMGSIRQGA